MQPRLEEAGDPAVVGRVLPVVRERHGEGERLDAAQPRGQQPRAALDVAGHARAPLGQRLEALALGQEAAEGVGRADAATRVDRDVVVPGARVQLHVPAAGVVHPLQLVPAQVERLARLGLGRVDEHRRAEAEALERALGAPVGVEPPVVERDQDRPRRQLARAATRPQHVLRDRDRMEAGRGEHRHLLRELAPGDRLPVDALGDAVVGEHRHGAAEGPRRPELRQLRRCQRHLRRRERLAMEVLVGEGPVAAHELRRQVQERERRERQQQQRHAAPARTRQPREPPHAGAADVAASPRVPQEADREVRIA